MHAPSPSGLKQRVKDCVVYGLEHDHRNERGERPGEQPSYQTEGEMGTCSPEPQRGRPDEEANEHPIERMSRVIQPQSDLRLLKLRGIVTASGEEETDGVEARCRQGAGQDGGAGRVWTAQEPPQGQEQGRHTAGDATE